MVVQDGVLKTARLDEIRIAANRHARRLRKAIPA
jgi:hypothetical protein